MTQKFFFFWTDLPPSNCFDFLWSCRFYLAYHHWKEGKKYQHPSISSYLNTHFQHPFYPRTWQSFYVFPSLWQATICDLSILILISCKRWSMKFSRSFGATELGMAEKSKHSLLVYCYSFRSCLSRSTSLLLIVLRASCKIFNAFCATETWLVHSSFFLAGKSILGIISNSFFDMPVLL